MILFIKNKAYGIEHFKNSIGIINKNENTAYLKLTNKKRY